MNRKKDLTNAQFPMLNSHPMRIEHWELSIGQIFLSVHWRLGSPSSSHSPQKLTDQFAGTYDAGSIAPPGGVECAQECTLSYWFCCFSQRPSQRRRGRRARPWTFTSSMSRAAMPCFL